MVSLKMVLPLIEGLKSSFGMGIEDTGLEFMLEELVCLQPLKTRKIMGKYSFLFMSFLLKILF
jgi:hypothetical protein